uniref:Uncharacterized protein n=1 Tax=Ananas comosus var. bracteatus TaxID=296719 RepID=A0A6V7PK41_ANACO|nr:unnamed protein product [Ananas comosus var. bracteatus]
MASTAAATTMPAPDADQGFGATGPHRSSGSWCPASSGGPAGRRWKALTRDTTARNADGRAHDGPGASAGRQRCCEGSEGGGGGRGIGVEGRQAISFGIAPAMRSALLLRILKEILEKETHFQVETLAREQSMAFEMRSADESTTIGSPSHLRECVRALGRRRLDRTYESWEGRCRRRPYPLGTTISSSHAFLWSPFSGTGAPSVERGQGHLLVLDFGREFMYLTTSFLLFGGSAYV